MSTVNGGAAVQHPEEAQPSQYFNLFWTDEYWNHLVIETNRYANVQGPPEKWLPVTVAPLYFIPLFYSFQVYTGREAGQEQGLAHRVVKDLVALFHHTCMKVCMDNFYTGVPLLRDLSALGLGACGTVRSNRKFLPADLLYTIYICGLSNF